VSKHELQQSIWPATFVSDANLASLIAEIRQALGDDAQRPRFVRTAHRYGYAFCGDVAADPGNAVSDRTASFCWLLRNRRRIPLQTGDNILGRDEDDIHIDSPTVSRRHARISIAGDIAVLEDLGSKNGTFVGGVAVSAPVRLRDGDEVRTGSVVFRFRMSPPKGVTATWSGPEPQP
jgi:hypothetical protein